MRLPTYSLRTILVIVTLVATYFASAQWYNAWLSTHYETYYTLSQLHSTICNGDSLQEVGAIFDSVKLVTQKDSADMSGVTALWTARKWPIETGDEFYFMSTSNGMPGVFQFREGKLVNHQNSDYGHVDGASFGNLFYTEEEARRGYSMPHPLLLRFGVLPFWVMLAALALTANHFIFPQSRSVRDNSSPAANTG